MVCILGMGDCKQKASTSLSVDLKTTVTALQSLITKNSQQSLAQQTSINQFTLVVGQNVVNSKLKTGQKINSTTQSSTNLTGTTKQQMISELQSSVTAAVNQAANAQAGFFSTGTAESKNRTDLKNAVEQSLTTTTLNETIQQAITNSVNINDAKIIIGGSVIGSDLDFSQDIVATAIALNVIDSVIENINTSLASSGSNLTVTQQATAASAGIDTITGQLFNFLGQYKWALIACIVAICCIVLILVGGVAFLGQTPAGQEAISTGAQVAAARAGGV